MKMPCMEKMQSQEMSAIELTQRELDCITHALQGKNLSQIAEILTLSIRSVRFYLTGVGIKFGIFAGTSLNQPRCTRRKPKRQILPLSNKQNRCQP
jgi:DNA-binding NarL/FixJ family response regulator